MPSYPPGAPPPWTRPPRLVLWLHCAVVGHPANVCRRLKCNRQSPCDQCLKRSIVSSCEYVPYEFRRNGDLGSARDSYVSDRAIHNGPTLNELSLQARVRHLEHVVHVLKAEHKSKQTTVAEPPSSSQPGSGEGVDEELVAVDHKRFTETAGPIVQGSRYISSTNWEAILDDVSSVCGI